MNTPFAQYRHTRKLPYYRIKQLDIRPRRLFSLACISSQCSRNNIAACFDGLARIANAAAIRHHHRILSVQRRHRLRVCQPVATRSSCRVQRDNIATSGDAASSMPQRRGDVYTFLALFPQTDYRHFYLAFNRRNIGKPLASNSACTTNLRGHSHLGHGLRMPEWLTRIRLAANHQTSTQLLNNRMHLILLSGTPSGAHSPQTQCLRIVPVLWSGYSRDIDARQAAAAPISGAASPSAPWMRGVCRTRSNAPSWNPSCNAPHHNRPAPTTEPESTIASGSNRFPNPARHSPSARAESRNTSIAKRSPSAARHTTSRPSATGVIFARRRRLYSAAKPVPDATGSI